VRFTDNIDEMRAFLEILGLRARIESERGGWVDMVAGYGIVALHDAATSDTGGVSGETRLSFEADDLDELARRLDAAGVADVTVYDEAYGRSLRCRDPLGDEIRVDGRSDDLFGYALHEAEGDERWRVMPVRFTDPHGPYGGFLVALGLVRQGAPDESFVIHVGPQDAGQVGLHHTYEGELPLVPGPGAVHLTFETTEPLDEVADRLVGKDFEDAVVTSEDWGSMLTVTDPDGREMQVHEPAASA
jgi:hypothetical protein